MRRLILDSCIVIDYWRRRWNESARRRKPHHPTQWATDLIELFQTNAIVTPVAIEFLAGFTQREELQAARAFLAQFQCIDEQAIPEDDWHNTRRLAERIPRKAKPRHMGDCLIRAIADRLRFDVQTSDQGFPT